MQLIYHHNLWALNSDNYLTDDLSFLVAQNSTVTSFFALCGPQEHEGSSLWLLAHGYKLSP